MKNVHVFVPVFLYAVTMLIFRHKNLGRSDDGKQRKKRGWPYAKAFLSDACQLEVKLFPALLEVCLDATKLVSASVFTPRHAKSVLPVDAPRSKTSFG